ncbi:HNH endonuclease [Geomonas agri]|uniref:HNH endonuclease n=1 Tax=Geomonas agri TaxID=2873702 RepID=UPI001CD3FCBC|nr:HNH endonuclease signature motif containing protein [Geomonas agri]
MNISADQLQKAMEDFDQNMRNHAEWSAWTENRSYKFAIMYNGRIYPVKQILAMATGHPKNSFSGGAEANTVVKACGLKIISLRASSWSIKSDSDAIKGLDKSAFTQGTGIPIEIRPFFLEHELQAGERYPVKLICNGGRFDAFIAMENSQTGRTRLFWHKDFINELAARFPVHYDCIQENELVDGLPTAQMRLTRLEGFNSYIVTFQEVEPTNIEWSEEELEAAVRGYLLMREQEVAGSTYNKAEINRTLREGKLSKRSKASIEYRMQNISSVLRDIDEPIISGYLPAQNVGAKTKTKIQSILDRLEGCKKEDYELTNDQEVLDTRVKRLLKRKMNAVPPGQQSPTQSTITTLSYFRDPSVKTWVLQASRGHCEACTKPAPFANKDGLPYLEVHHVITLAEGGPDTVNNAVALCPNCHRRCHLSNDGEAYTAHLYTSVQRLQKNQ